MPTAAAAIAGIRRSWAAADAASQPAASPYPAPMSAASQSAEPIAV
ncbi:MAG: hypothetical protein RXP27_01080 [Nitrososphaeria archaeon]|jgi:hypothetical protein